MGSHMEGSDKKPGENCSEKVCQPIKVPTDDEVTALNALRAIKDRVREIKKIISELSDEKIDEQKDQKSKLQDEMERLNEEWKAWEKRREEATRERMILLGHIDP